MTLEETTKVSEYNPTPANNRCDRCGSRAYFRFTKGKFTLEWCHHHGNKFKATLIGHGWNVEGRTDILTGEAESYKKVYGKNAF